jgi:NAD-dependent SIR2 family protein deacetylase
LVWEWYRERRQRIRNARPNAAHEAIARLAQRTDEFLLVTQNVDDLHARAGVAAERMVRIHGDIFVTRCSRCDSRRFEHEYEQEHEFRDAPNALRQCGLVLSGSVNSCLGANYSELKIFSMAELAIS